ncbi:hypothetical protein M0813_13142 [Anaeramoeba flamelloides]|uniref:Mannosyltransferase n=1 Tax=Anaeramoeba flamelloides TaxID=1746091 RepID=A0ABQ8ZA19_9EUKA|nr:hypothetical protein M0813_13142 [Anaeramoeba flamelloides]
MVILKFKKHNFFLTKKEKENKKQNNENKKENKNNESQNQKIKNTNNNNKNNNNNNTNTNNQNPNNTNNININTKNNSNKNSKEKKLVNLFLMEIKTHSTFFITATIVTIIFSILSLLHFLPYMSRTESYYTAKNCYGDLPFHLNIIKSFTKGINSEWGSLKDLQFPIYSGTALVYPFIADFHTALINGGCQCTLQATLVVTTVIEFCCLLTLLYFFFQRIVRNQIVSLITIFLVIFGGGFGWVYILKDLIFGLPEDETLIMDLNKYDYNFKIAKNKELFWFPFVDATLIPQRSALLGYCLAIFVLTLIYHLISANWIRIKFKSSLKIAILASLLTGLLPLTHTYSYLVIAFITSITLILNFPYSKKYSLQIKKKYFLTILLYAVLSNIIAFPQLFLFMSRVSSDNFIRFEPIWKNEWTNPISYIILSFGPIFLIGIFSLPLICNTGYKTKFFISFILLFIFSILIMLQPWKYDNIKLLNFPFFILALATARFLVFLLDIHLKGLLDCLITPLVLILCIIIILPGLLSMASVAVNVSELFDQELIQIGEFVSKNTEKNALFAVPDTNFHRNPVTTLAGRQLLVGQEGWLWSHGINADSERRQVATYLSNGIRQDTQKTYFQNLFLKFNITYIMDSDYKIHSSIIEHFNFLKIWESENYRIFRVIFN